MCGNHLVPAYTNSLHIDNGPQDGQKLYQPKDRETKGTVSLAAVRDILSAIPTVLGSWIETNQTFGFKLEDRMCSD